MLSDEQMSKRWPVSLLNDEQMSNWVGVKHLPDYWKTLRPKKKMDDFFVGVQYSYFLLGSIKSS